jgi:Glycosyltransferase family 92
MPKSDCIVDYETGVKRVGDRFTTGQAVASTAALRRYEHRKTYKAHLDMDEYIVPPAHVTEIKSTVRDDESYDYLTSQLTWFASCDSDKSNTSKEQLLPFDTSLCYNPDATPRKSIMKTSRILAFFVHCPSATVDGQRADRNYKHWDDVTVAHYRSRRLTRGPKSVQFVNRLYVMARYREKLHQAIDAYWKHLVQE